MKKATKVWLITAGALVAVGCILFTGVMAARGWDFMQLSTGKYEKNTHEIGESFRHIAMTTGTADIRFALSDDGKCRVECFEEENAKHTVAVEGDTLVIRQDDQRSWRDHIGFHFDLPTVTVYLPQTAYETLTVRESTGNITVPKTCSFKNVDVTLSTGNVDFFASAAETVRIKASTGSIHVEDVTVGALQLSVTTGSVRASGVTCKGGMTADVTTGEARLADIACETFGSDGSTGALTLRNVVAAQKLSVDRTTGDVKFDGCDAAEIYAKTNTGDVTGSLLSDKVFITESNMGDVDVPKTTTGGRCEIYTNTGDIRIKIG